MVVSVTLVLPFSIRLMSANSIPEDAESSRRLLPAAFRNFNRLRPNILSKSSLIWSFKGVRCNELRKIMLCYNTTLQKISYLRLYLQPQIDIGSCFFRIVTGNVGNSKDHEERMRLTLRRGLFFARVLSLPTGPGTAS